MILIPFPLPCIWIQDARTFLYLYAERKPTQESGIKKIGLEKGLFCGIILVSSLADLCFPYRKKKIEFQIFFKGEISMVHRYIIISYIPAYHYIKIHV